MRPKKKWVKEKRINKTFFYQNKGRSILTTFIFLIVLAIALSSLIAINATSVNALSIRDIINKIKR